MSCMGRLGLTYSHDLSRCGREESMGKRTVVDGAQCLHQTREYSSNVTLAFSHSPRCNHPLFVSGKHTRIDRTCSSFPGQDIALLILAQQFAPFTTQHQNPPLRYTPYFFVDFQQPRGLCILYSTSSLVASSVYKRCSLLHTPECIEYVHLLLDGRVSLVGRLILAG